MRKDTTRQVAVFMDYHSAAIREPLSMASKIIMSDRQSHVRYDGETGDGTLLGNNRSTNNESHKHNIEQNAIREYFKLLEQELRGYDEILILGTGKAPNEFRNFYQANNKLSSKKITVGKSDYISDNQFLHKINNFFNPN